MSTDETIAAEALEYLAKASLSKDLGLSFGPIVLG
jgi:hypothetical protein